MPSVRRRKRASNVVEEEAEPSAASPASSPEPPTQRRRVEEDEDEAYGNDVDGNDTASSGNQSVKKMVRFALACEFQRRPIRRADVSEKVLGTHASRQFREVFNAAQTELRSVFGMEMVEMPSREKITLAQRRAAQKSQSQSKPTVSWQLVSTLPSEYHDPAILPTLTAPNPDEEARYTAAYTLLVSLISLSGGSLPDAKMERYLKRLAVEDNMPMGAPGGGSDKTEKVLKRMEREGYIVKIKETSGTGDDDIYWAVGARGKVEVGEGGVKGLTKAVYGELEGAEEEELERKIARSLGIGEAPAPGATRNGQATKKKRGRKRRDEQSEDRGDEDDEDESDGTSDDEN